MFVLLKTFFIGVVLGLLAAAGVLYAVPAVDQKREASIVTVAPNGGNTEVFHSRIPMDQILQGDPRQAGSVPPGLEWPSDEILANVRAELFKIRNAQGVIVGVAARTAAKTDDTDVIDWVLHLPARGSLFVNMDVTPREGGFRLGQIRSGSREFSLLHGFMTERWVETASDDEDAPTGRIELSATYASTLEPLDTEEAAE